MSLPEIRGRARELGSLRTGFDQQEASVRWVVGLPGVGKTATVREAAADFHEVYHRVPPLSDPQQRSALAASLAGTVSSRADGEVATSPPTWDALFARLVDGAAERRPTVLIVDDAHRWDEARARYAPALAGALRRARSLDRPVHVVLLAPELPTRSAGELDPAPPLAIRPLTFRAALPFLPGATVHDRLRAWAVFGGLPGILRSLDTNAGLGTNVRRLILTSGGPLQEHPLHLLERHFQTPTRYAAILAALAAGEGDWSAVQAGVPDLSASGQAGPYLKRLEEVGLVEVRRSLDAPPRSRSRRYRITDPFFAFWYRFILPHRDRMAGGSAESLHADVIRPGLAAHTTSLFPQACRDYMTHDAMERLGANAREYGSLWGAGYDIPVAGVLASGSPFYGVVVGDDVLTGRSAFAALDTQIRETRYGFGRERRLRVLFIEGSVPSALQREAARRQDTLALGLDTLTDTGD